MFNFIIYFVVALIVYLVSPAGRPPGLPWWQAASGWVGVYLVFSLMCLTGYGRLNRRLGRALAAGWDLDGPRALTRLNLVLSAAAIGALGVLAHGLEFRSYVRLVPWVGDLSSFQGLVGMSVFIGLLMTLWYWSWPAHRAVFGYGVSRRGYVVGQVRLAVPIIVPWLVLSAVFDGLEAIPWPWLNRSLNNPAGVLVLFGLGLLVAAYFFPLLVRYVWGLKPLPPGPVRDRVLSVARGLGFDPAQVHLWPLMDGRGLSAGVLGFFRRTRYLLISPALLEALPPDELDAVIAHEAGHVHYRHVRFFLLIMLGYGLTTAVVLEILLPLAAAGEAVLFRVPPTEPLAEAGLALWIGLPLVAFMLLYFRGVMGWFMRHFERQADAFALAAHGNPLPISASLERLARLSGRIRNLPSWHHFSIAQRVGFLSRAWNQPEIVRRHDRLVRRGRVAFVLGLVLVGFLGFQVSFGAWGDHLRRWSIDVRQTRLEAAYPDLGRRARDDLARAAREFRPSARPSGT